MLKILINTSNSQQGGALQVATSFIQEANKSRLPITFYVILGKATLKVIDKNKYENIQFYEVNIHAKDSIFSFRKKLNDIEKKVKPSAVITIFGPCYWKPKAPHIMGFANGYLLYEDTYFFKIWQGWKSWSYKLKKAFHKYLLKREALLFWVETEDSQKRLARLLDIDVKKIVVASNNCSNLFRASDFEKCSQLPLKKRTRLVYISSYYEHKGFELIVPILEILKKRDIDVEFVVTINEDKFIELFSAYNNVINLGSVKPSHCPDIYNSADIVFIPTLLETFSAVYPEAMYMQKPIITTNLPFAKDICHDAALYFDPSSPEDAADKIELIIKSKPIKFEIIKKGNQRVLDFDLPEIRFEKVVNRILTEIKV